ncbi:MAG: 3D domain-containing protein [Oscillospiraceae bacterium]|nr:3D domain-containing protein [Oscillospiraceae bacterium]
MKPKTQLAALFLLCTVTFGSVIALNGKTIADAEALPAIQTVQEPRDLMQSQIDSISNLIAPSVTEMPEIEPDRSVLRRFDGIITTPMPTPVPTSKMSSPVWVFNSDRDVGVEYVKYIEVSATAYTTERQSNKITATGTTARVGAIAVDPTVIPYGTRMYIVSARGDWIYGYAVAEDCGGGIKGNKIDLFFDTYDECIEFGVRRAIVYVLD